MKNVHVARKFARTNPDKGDPVAMSRIHICLNFKNESRKRIAIGRNNPFSRSTRSRRRRKIEKGIEHQLHAKVVHGAAEKNRRDFAFQNSFDGKILARYLEHLNFLDDLIVGRFVGDIADKIIAQIFDRYRCTEFPAGSSLEKMHSFFAPIVDTFEKTAVADRPIHRICADPEHPFELVEQLERLERRSITFVHKSDDRNSAPTTDFKKLQI